MTREEQAQYFIHRLEELKKREEDLYQRRLRGEFPITIMEKEKELGALYQAIGDEKNEIIIKMQYAGLYADYSDYILDHGLM